MQRLNDKCYSEKKKRRRRNNKEGAPVSETNATTKNRIQRRWRYNHKSNNKYGVKKKNENVYAQIKRVHLAQSNWQGFWAEPNGINRLTVCMRQKGKGFSAKKWIQSQQKRCDFVVWMGTSEGKDYWDCLVREKWPSVGIQISCHCTRFNFIVTE